MVTGSGPRGLTLDSIVGAALELIREEGFPALSMRKLADRCGVGAMTLYGYVRTKDELLGLIADDLLATGGTADAAVRLVRKLGGNVIGCAFIVELSGLKGRERLGGINCFSLIHYD